MRISPLHEIIRRPEIVLGLATFALHLWVNGAYGYFRDELYFIACGRHPAWGYTDQPPLTPIIAWASDAAFHSLRGLRIAPAAAAAGAVALTASAAKQLGGGVYARWLGGVAVLAGGALQTLGVLVTTDSLQPLAWLAIALLVMAAERERSALIAAGAVAGVAFLAKYTVGFYGICLLVGLAATPQRRLLTCWQAWAGLALALAIAAPNLWWQAANGWPFLAHTTVLAAQRNIPLSPPAFAVQEILTLGPATAPVWIAGLVAFAFWPRFAPYRWVAVSFVLLIAGLVVGHGRPYYAAPAFPLLMAGGAAALEAILPRVPRFALATLIVIVAIVSAPLTISVLPVETLIAYQRAIGFTPSTGERLKIAVLPQYFADMFGWPEMARTVAEAYEKLAPEDQRRAVFFGRNYGEAAAVDFFAPGRPPAVSAHENYFLWGIPPGRGDVVFVFAPDSGGPPSGFRSVEAVGAVAEPFAMPDESGLTLWLCRDPKRPPSEVFPTLRHFG